MSEDIEQRLDVGNQKPANWGTIRRLEDWLTRCWKCQEPHTADRNDPLGLCAECYEEARSE